MNSLTESIESKWITRLQNPINNTLKTMGVKAINFNESSIDFQDEQGNDMVLIVKQRPTKSVHYKPNQQ